MRFPDLSIGDRRRTAILAELNGVDDEVTRLIRITIEVRLSVGQTDIRRSGSSVVRALGTIDVRQAVTRIVAPVIERDSDFVAACAVRFNTQRQAGRK